MILVTSGNGNVARQVIPRLAEAGLPVRALRGSAGKDEALQALGATEVVVGDIRDPAVVRRAAQGVSAIFHVCPGGLAYWEREIGAAVIDAAVSEGVEHLVLSTLLHPIISDLLQHQTKRDVEERLVSTPVNWTILQPCDYMQTLIPPSTSRTGELPVAYGLGRRHSVVDLRDVAEVAVKVIAEGRPHYWARYELCGPHAIESAELAAAVARACGRDVRVKPVTGPDYMRIWAGEPGPPIGSAHGLDDPEGRAFARRVLVAIEQWYGAHDYVGNPNVLTWLLGRAPRSIEDYARDLFQGAA